MLSSDNPPKHIRVVEVRSRIWMFLAETSDFAIQLLLICHVCLLLSISVGWLHRHDKWCINSLGQAACLVDYQSLNPPAFSRIHSIWNSCTGNWNSCKGNMLVEFQEMRISFRKSLVGDICWWVFVCLCFISQKWDGYPYWLQQSPQMASYSHMSIKSPLKFSKSPSIPQSHMTFIWWSAHQSLYRVLCMPQADRAWQPEAAFVGWRWVGGFGKARAGL